jgi:ELWxxDGT repeat protein
MAKVIYSVGNSVPNGLWVSDGTSAGTKQLEGPFDTGPYDLIALNGGVLFFAGTSGPTGLWFTDGTAGAATQIGPGGNMMAVAGTVAVFGGPDASGGEGLWATDGTSGGTQEIVSGNFIASAGADIPEGDAVLGHQQVLTVGNDVYFAGYDSNGQDQLWVTDGTAVGTQEVAHGQVTESFGGGAMGPDALIPQDLVQLGGYLLFDGISSTNAQGLFSLTIGSNTLIDFNAITAPGSPAPLEAQEITPLSTGVAVFKASNGSGIPYLWVTDGATASQVSSSIAVDGGMVSLGTVALFAGIGVNPSGGATTPAGVWRTDGTAGGTTELSANLSGGDAIDLTSFGTLVAFSTDSVGGLFITDGTTVTEIDTSSHVDLSSAIANGNTLLFNKSGNLYSTTGTSASITFVSLTPAANIPDTLPATSGDAIPYYQVLCFREGTRIRTPDGDVAIEELAIGDAVLTYEGAARPIRWIGHRRVDCRYHPRPEAERPVRIRRGAFGDGMPQADLFLSPDHAVYAESALVPVKYLIDGDAIEQIAADEVTYFHIELDTHDVVLAEGLPAETWLDTGMRDHFDNYEGPIRLFADIARPGAPELVWENTGFAPLRVDGPEVDRVRERVRGAGYIRPASTTQS